MLPSLLLVTPRKELGEQLRTKTQRTLLGDLRVTDDFAEAIRTTRQRNCPLALLDSEIERQGISVTDIGYALRQINPNIQFILIQDRRGETAAAPALAARAVLPASFDFPAFQAAVMDVLPDTRPAPPRPLSRASEPEPGESSTPDDLPWLQDVNRAAQHLTRLTLESSGQAALITRDQELWAYAGQFPRAAAEELAASIQRYWDREEKTDLLRFIRLAATGAEHMLYATRLTSNMILALVFDSETPFSTIRSQAGKLALSLAATPPGDSYSTGTHRRGVDSDAPSEMPPLSAVLADVPLPDPLPASRIETGRPPAQQDQARAGTVPVERLSNLFAGPVFSVESSPSMALRPAPEPEYEIADNLVVDLDADAAARSDARPGDPAQFAETRKGQAYGPGSPRPGSMTEVARRIVLEPASPAVYNLDYACLLIPRFENHFLTGDLTDRLADWMQQICVAFGWRLEHIAVRPEYLQWIASVPPAISPSHLMRIMRQQSSDRIFIEFPRYHKENPSGDFWAPGYLIVGGGQPQPQKLIKDFIRQTRQRQGIIHPR
jgi:REP element-mobilizing transposase RayT